MSSEPTPDRRQLRRTQTIEQIVQLAVDVMAEEGVGGLSLGEVARRLGIRPPSLYVYFDSKHALYDAVFALGWRSVRESMLLLSEPDATSSAVDYLGGSSGQFVRWCVENPVYAQLMLWRPVPRWEPSETAFEPAVETLALTTSRLARLQELGKLSTEVPLDELVGVWTSLMTGVISRQLANAPGESFDSGRVTQLLPALTAMYCTHYTPVRRTGRPKGKP